MLLVLLRPGQGDVEFGDLAAETTQRRLGTLDGVAGGEELVAQIGVALFGGSHELSQPIDLGVQGPWVVVGRVPRHRR